MATNLVLDENLISQAQKIGHHKIKKKDAVITALKEYIARKRQIKLIELRSV